MATGGGKEVHSIVCACFAAAAVGPSPLDDLRRRVLRAVEQAGATAERVVDLEIAFAAIFLNSTAALECARHLCGEAGAAVPLKLGVHMGPLDAADAQIDQRAPLRLARQIAVLAPVGRVLVSPLFHHFVTQFDHACKRLIHPAASVLDAQGRSIPVFEARFESLPAAAPRPQHAAAASNAAAAVPAEAGFLPADPARRTAFLARAEKLLAEEIGPLARLIVRNAVTSARSPAAFYQQLVDALPDAGRRATLLKRLGRYE